MVRIPRGSSLRGSEYLAAERTRSVQRKCAITAESILPVLEAAHIQPFADDGPNATSNGLLLRSDFHRLFDLGYVTINPELRVEVSPRIRDEWYNGKAYYRLHGRELVVLPHTRRTGPIPVTCAGTTSASLPDLI